jgi:hypothetical protein
MSVLTENESGGVIVARQQQRFDSWHSCDHENNPDVGSDD